ncbi:MAG: ATP-binding protein [Candidatus Kapaibacterium sp.]|nr:MAG: ATP-binding protein [Candidatus Kapabacteria bacterium]
MEQKYLSLAPTNLKNKQAARYDGTGFSASLQEFSAQDQQALLTIYQHIKSVYDVWLYMKESPNYSILQADTDWFVSEDFLSIARELGSIAEYPSLHIKKIIHDIRGGALMSMVSHANKIKRFNLYHEVEHMRSFVFLARDQAKMMRNAVHNIDVITRAADERIRIHSIYDYVKKWNNFEYRHNDRTITVKVQCYYEGNVTTCCLEASALDRVVYNFVNNALRFSKEDTIIITIFPVGNILRWVIENTMKSESVAWLQESTGNNLSRLFQGGITSDGNGIGLSNCADIVGASFGISAAEAIDRRYISATVKDETFYACFHWNAVVEEE